MIKQLIPNQNKKIEKNKIAAFILLLLIFAISTIMIKYTCRIYGYYLTGNLFSIKNITKSYNSTEAPNDGSIGIWQGNGDINDGNSDYYIVHDYSFYGKRLLEAKENDTFKIKGKKYTINCIIYIENNTTYEEIKDIAMPGGETATFQVCVPETNLYKILIAS